MIEHNESKEVYDTVSRERVVDAFRKIAELGAQNPDQLDPHDPDVIEAQELFKQWATEQKERLKDDPSGQERFNFEKTMLFVDAGFTNPWYLNEILRGWLAEDAKNLEKHPGDAQRAMLRNDIADAMKRIRGMLTEKGL